MTRGKCERVLSAMTRGKCERVLSASCNDFV